MFHLKVGDDAPNFECADENGQVRTLAEFRGKKLILYFYPQDNTPTCTVEACNLRDNYAHLTKKGYEILGVSPDSSKKHVGFRSKFGLQFSLLADVDHAVAKNYGIFGEKTFMGRTFDGIHRTTFVMDEMGKIERIITKVNSKMHAEQIFEA